MTQEQEWANAVVRKLFVGMLVAVVALFGGVWIVGAKSAQNIKNSEAAARIILVHQLRSGCERSVRRDIEMYGTNRDLAGFAADASATRQKEGDLGAAVKYQKREESARDRMATISTRLPSKADEAGTREFCDGLYPLP